MAGTTRGRCSGIAVRMAFYARRGHVGSMQRKGRDVMVEGGRPPRSGGVAACAVRREPSGLVVRVGSAVVLRHMTTGALRRCVREIARCVAACAILDLVATGQWEEVVVGELRAPTRTHRVVAFDAIGGEAGTRMVREPGSVEFVDVAVDTIVPDASERQRIVSHMAIHTAEVAVRADEREAVLLVQLGDIIHQPGPWGVASRAVVAHGHRVNIGVARDAVRWGGRVEHHRTMAGAAIHLGMDAYQREPRTVVIKAERIAHHDPAIRNMAGRAVDLEGRTVG